MSKAAVIGGTRVFTYTAVGLVPSQVPEAQIEAWIRAGCSWNDTMLAWIRGTEVKTEVVSATELARLSGGTIHP